jgi:hypothetical protein
MPDPVPGLKYCTFMPLIKSMIPLIQVDRIRKTRTFLFNIIQDVSTEQLNVIPAGFSNNLVWHLGHMIAAQQGICYLRAGLPPAVAGSYLELYKSGTKPLKPVSEEDVEEIKSTFFSSLDQLEKDVDDNLFATYSAWTTRYGVEITSIEDALQFLLFHEGLHSGYITYMKRLVLQ